MRKKFNNFAMGLYLAAETEPEGVLNDFFKNEIGSKFGSLTGPAGQTSLSGLLTAILSLLLLFVGSLSVLFLIVGGFRYVTAHGNEEAAEAAKKTMTQAVVGLIVVVMSFAVISIIASLLITEPSL